MRSSFWFYINQKRFAGGQTISWPHFSFIVAKACESDLCCAVNSAQFRWAVQLLESCTAVLRLSLWFTHQRISIDYFFLCVKSSLLQQTLVSLSAAHFFPADRKLWGLLVRNNFLKASSGLSAADFSAAIWIFYTCCIDCFIVDRVFCINFLYFSSRVPFADDRWRPGWCKI